MTSRLQSFAIECFFAAFVCLALLKLPIPDAQVRVSEYNQLKGQVNQQNRKQTGSLAVRDLAGVVSSKGIISTENLVTLFVVVSKHTKLEWQSSYEKFCEFVVSECIQRPSSLLPCTLQVTRFPNTAIRCAIACCSSTVHMRFALAMSVTAL